MRTLNRPMFRMGGPIKEGVMHGIREPYRGGGPAALVGDPVFPKTRGRAHHAYWLIPQALRMIGTQVAKRGLTSAASGEMAKKGIQESIKRASGAVGSAGSAGGATGIAAAAPTGWKGWLARDPVVRSALWAKDALINPTTKGWGKSALRFATSPSSLLLGGWMGYDALKDDKKGDAEGAPTNVPLNPALQELQKKKKSAATENAAAFAKNQRNQRVEKYLKMMGYDSSKKMAIADALIDASKIVSDRGTLDRKNITGELINPIIQATSKRLDKPQQIREAVGLMATKAEIEKDLEDPSIKALRVAQLEKLNREASPSISETIMGYMASKKDDVKGQELVDLVRLAADKKNTPFKFISEEEIAKIPGMENKTALEIVSQTAEKDGVYMVGDTVIEIIGGTPTQIK